MRRDAMDSSGSVGAKSLNARDLTLRLVAGASTRGDAPGAAHDACEMAYRELTRRLGQSGSDALLTRALARAQADHPALNGIRSGGESGAGLEGVAEAVRVHGGAPVAAGLEETLETLLGLLGRLIGDDMVARLVEQSSRETHDEEDRR